MKAKNRYERAQQVLNWIDYNWPIGRRVVLMWKAKLQDSVFGETYRKGNVLYICLSKKRCSTWEIAIDIVIHEASHCILWGMASVEDKVAHHPPAFWSLYGEIKDAFDHGNGAVESAEFPTKEI